MLYSTNAAQQMSQISETSDIYYCFHLLKNYGIRTMEHNTKCIVIIPVDAYGTNGDKIN